jgi:outer membrane protein
MVRRIIHSGLGITFLIVLLQAKAEEVTQGVDGDIGLGSYYLHSIIRGKHDEFTVLPYLDFDYERMFARVDTLGIKTLRLGYGHLELIGRISQDGFTTNTPSLQGLKQRDTSIPVGIGTFQETPLGAFLINAFHDVNQSKGDLFEVIYAGELDRQNVTFYPLIGTEYQSKEYVRYYYGISSQESASSQYTLYQPVGSFNQLIGLIVDIHLADEFHLICNMRRKWLGDAIYLSPIVSQKYLDTDYLSLSYRFK